MKFNLLLVLLPGLFVAPSLSAQTVSLSHGHYSNFGVSTNTALSLLSPGGSVGFIGRQQWVGIDGAPQAYMGSAHIGLNRLQATTGVLVRQDRIGVLRHTEASLFFSKSIRLAERDYIGLSLNAGLVHFDGRYSSLDPMDQSFLDEVESDALLGFGAVVYRPDVYYAGVSLPRFTVGGVGAFGDTRYNFYNRFHVTGGVLWPIGTDLHIRPSVQISYSEDVGTEVDGSAMVFMKRMVGLGLGARSQGDLSGLLRLNFSGFGIGYSYQFNTQNEPMNRRITNSTHEVALSFDFGGMQRLL